MPPTPTAISPALVPCTQPESPQRRLICIPQAGAGAAVFRPWGPLLSSGVELIAVRLPGRESRFVEPPLHTMAAVVGELRAACLELPALPTAILGHCSGALVAFELARALRSAGARAPIALVASGQGAPTSPSWSEPWHALPDDELREVLVRLDPTVLSDDVTDELFQLCAPAIRADFEVAETYAFAPDAPLTIPIQVVVGTDDEWVATGDADAWRQQTTGAFELEVLPGSHLLQESWEELAGVVDRFLASAGTPR